MEAKAKKSTLLYLKKWFILSFFSMFLYYSCTNDDESLDTIGADETQITSDVKVNDSTTEIILRWNEVWLSLDRYAYGMRPNATARALAYIHLAAYETAVPAMGNYRSLGRRLSGLNIDRDIFSNDIDINIALNTCYETVLNHFMYNISDSSVEAQIASLASTIESEFGSNLTAEVIANSNTWGNYVAQQVISYSQTDTEAESQILEPQPLSYEPPVGNGFWTYSADEERALFPYWGSVRTFVIAPNETSTVEPIAYSEDESSEYYAQMLEVYNNNNAAKTTDEEQLWIAEFWSDDVEGLMMSPPGRQISIANQLIEQFDLDAKSTIALLLRLGFSLNDAAVSTWHYKYTYMVMRPNVYIHEFIDADFQTNLYRLVYWPNPSFPGYPSGHSTFASAAGGIFIDVFGDTVDFTDTTHDGRTEFLGDARQFSSISEMAAENAYSRIPLGVHIRMDCDEGLRLGYEISDAVIDYNLTRRN